MEGGERSVGLQRRESNEIHKQTLGRGSLRLRRAPKVTVRAPLTL